MTSAKGFASHRFGGLDREYGITQYPVRDLSTRSQYEIPQYGIQVGKPLREVGGAEAVEEGGFDLFERDVAEVDA